MRKYLLLAAAAVVALPVTASAGRFGVSKHERSDSQATVFGVPIDSASAGVGYSNYTGEAAPDIAPGPSWNARMNLDISQPLKIGAAYVGAKNSFTGDIDNFNLYTNQVQAEAVLSPYDIGDVTPFISAGIGLTRGSVAKNPELNVQFQSDTMGNIPLAAGAEYDVTKKLQVSARVLYDDYFDNEIQVAHEDANTDRWGILVNLGAVDF